MANTIVLGMQWGDEGKGKIVDLVCPAFDAVVRCQGGHNAGHTVRFGERHFALHFLPSGVVTSAMPCVLGNGMVIFPDALFAELEKLEKLGVATADRLFISDRAQVILPPHIALDKAREAARGPGKIGTTSRGIGPAYESKAARSGLRTGDLLASDLLQRLTAPLHQIVPQLIELGVGPPPRLESLLATCQGWARRLRPFLSDTTRILNRWIDEGKGVLFEGAQGALLDIDHGTYPYVTSSNSTAGGVCTGAGVAPARIDGVLGVAKAYTTRVGGGPFVGELEEATGEHLRRKGNEFGTTTGRPRRCGWFDAVAVRYARLLNGVGALALTKLDVLDELEEIKICTGYRYRGRVGRDFPAALEILKAAEPEYRTLPGWRSSTAGIREFDDLPQAARDYVAVIEEEVGVPVVVISTGPRREETILLDRPEMRTLVADRLARVVAHRDEN